MSERPKCQMPGCGVEVQPGQKYCDACKWEKDMELRKADEEDAA